MVVLPLFFLNVHKGNYETMTRRLRIGFRGFIGTHPLFAKAGQRVTADPLCFEWCRCAR
jgi:hypothetical protein